MANELKKIIVDGVEYTLPEGGSGGGSNHIIEVENLPTENIDEGAIYKLHTLKLYIGSLGVVLPLDEFLSANTTMVIVDTLPTTGESVIQGDNLLLYYSKEANAIYGYLDNETASSLGGSAGWYSADMLLPHLMEGGQYAGIFPSFDDIELQGEGAFVCAAWTYNFYKYKNGKFSSFELSLPIVRGSKPDALVFGDLIFSEASGALSAAFGGETFARGAHSFASGFLAKAFGDQSHAEGNSTTANGNRSHAEGESTTAGGIASHAEGSVTEATGSYSHSEGCRTHATTTSAHAEGYDTYATHIASHAEGESTTASGSHSHSEGYGTVASGETQHVQGRYNIADTNNKYAHIVGNGTGPGITGNNGDTTRSNAHTLDWNGNAWFKGNIRVGGTSWDDATPVGGSSSGGNTEEYKTLTITLNSTDNVKKESSGVIYYSLSDEQYNKIANLRCSEIKSIYFKSSNEYQDPEVHVFYGDKFYFTPTWRTYEENIIGVTPEDEVYPKLRTIGGTYNDPCILDATLFGLDINPMNDTKRFSITSSRGLTILYNVESFIDFCLNPEEGITSVLTLNIEYK